ncbi:MAG TPA: ATP-binding protein, partial [Thermodesulfovibrionales bacterium]|nr:ATP-binding protein [Thermodesulfovibrionales bacterium]
MAAMFGYSSVEEFTDAVSSQLLEKSEDGESLMTKIRANGYVKGEERRLRRKDGTHIWCSVTAKIHHDEKSRIERIDGVMEDITERKNLEAQLLQAQKMEAVGQLAGGIAHDFNNILTAMMGYGHILKMKMKEDVLSTYVNHILSLSDRASNLTQSLLAFSRKQIMNSKPVNLNDIIRTVERLLIRIIGEDIRLQTVLSERDLIVMADHVQMEQVLMNLATNARDAMLHGGLLTFATEHLYIDSRFIREHGFGKEGGWAVLSITDTGTGMDKKLTEKIFEPFFTTKAVGKGTGLGLAMVYGIVKQHGGHINVYSEIEKGTTFRIYLPLIQEAVEDMKPEVIAPIETGTETILLVEDEPEVRQFTKKLLEEYGYKVIEAVDGEDAVKKFRLYRDKIDLLLLDAIMPGKNGREAYNDIRNMKTDIKAIFLSGYPGDTIQKRGILDEGFNLIMKPVSPTRLLKKIRDVLDGDLTV